jgi:hypothetical protein
MSIILEKGVGWGRVRWGGVGCGVEIGGWGGGWRESHDDRVQG